MNDPSHEIDLSGTAHGQFKIARRVLHADELHRMTDLRPRFEKEMKLPGDSRGPDNRVYLFSIDGMLDGVAVKGALFAGEAMLVQATTLKRAERICKEGLADTKRLLLEEFEQRSVIERVAANEGVSIEGGGGKVRPREEGDMLRTDPTLKKMLAHLIGKLPWKH